LHDAAARIVKFAFNFGRPTALSLRTFRGGCGLIRCSFEAFFPSNICSHAIASAENDEISAKSPAILPVIAFRATDLIFVAGTATAGTARQLPVNGA